MGRFTAHALDYADLEDCQVLVLKELGAMDREDTEKRGLSTLKFLSSDDRGYTVEMPVRDEETGSFKNIQYKIPAITMISTTTRLSIDPQFERRTWFFNVDESTEQTKKVAVWKAKNEKQKAEKLLGLRKYTDYEFSGEVLKRFVEKLEPISIIIPFPKTLTEVLGYQILRVRGDIDKIYNFLKFYGLFNKKRLQKLNGNVYVISPELCMEALKIIVQPLVNMLSRMDERTKNLFTILKKLELGDAQASISKIEREKIAVKLGKSEPTVRKYLSSLEKTGFVSGDGKRPKTFTLLYSVETIEKKIAGVLAKLESANVLMDKMQKEAQKWLNSISFTENLRKGINYKESNIPNIHETQINMPHRGKTQNDSELSIKQADSAKTSADDWLNKKQPILRRETDKPKELWIKKQEGNKITAKDGNVLFQCPLCASYKKQMFFNSQEDLDLHIRKFHGKPSYVR